MISRKPHPYPCPSATFAVPHLRNPCAGMPPPHGEAASESVRAGVECVESGSRSEQVGLRPCARRCPSTTPTSTTTPRCRAAWKTPPSSARLIGEINDEVDFLDTIMRNKYDLQPEKLHAWESLSRVERTPRPGEERQASPRPRAHSEARTVARIGGTRAPSRVSLRPRMKRARSARSTGWESRAGTFWSSRQG